MTEVSEAEIDALRAEVERWKGEASRQASSLGKHRRDYDLKTEKMLVLVARRNARHHDDYRMIGEARAQITQLREALVALVRAINADDPEQHRIAYELARKALEVPRRD